MEFNGEGIGWRLESGWMVWNRVWEIWGILGNLEGLGDGELKGLNGDGWLENWNGIMEIKFEILIKNWYFRVFENALFVDKYWNLGFKIMVV